MLTEAVLTRLKLDAATWLAPLTEACNRYEIDSDDRVAAFLAQCLHESAGFAKLREDLHYSAGGLMHTWPKRFTAAEAIEFAYDDIRIAERVYGGRMGNGPEGIGDGYAYRGGGLLMLTGRGMYRKASVHIGPDFEAAPAMIALPTWAAVTAAWVFSDEKGCCDLADRDAFAAITARINGSANPKFNGLDSRVAWLRKVREAQAATC